MILTYAWNDEPVQTIENPARGDIEPLIEEADIIVGHNLGNFDSILLQHCLGVDIPLEKVFDTMACALSHSLPGSLGKLCEVMGLIGEEAKDKEGKELIQLFCRPRPKNQILRRATKKTHPDKWNQFLSYAGRDITSMRALYRKLPRWNYDIGKPEHALWVLDQTINRRGVKVDLDLARTAIDAVATEKDRLALRTQEMTEGEVLAATQRDALLKHILSIYGVSLPDMQKATLERRLEDPDLPEPVKELLAIRLSASSTSVTKYQRLLDAVSSDGRLRGTLQYCGAARTGRWAGRLFQPQNLPRTPDEYTPERQAAEIQAFKDGYADLAIGDVIEAASWAIRGSLVASEGKQLVAADLSNIEGRVLAWLAGEAWKIQAFIDYDNGVGPDLYKVTAGRVLGKNHTEITKQERQVQGKVPELACLGGDTLVLTDNGVKPITQVTKTDCLWDGVEWVAHDGLVDRGQKHTILLAGIEMTADHHVMAGRQWQPAKTVVSEEYKLCRALEVGSESLKSWARCEKLLADCSLSESNVRAAPSHMKSCFQISYGGRRQGATSAQRNNPASNGRNGFGTLVSFQMMAIDGGSATASLLALIAATTPTIVVTKTTGGEASAFTNRGGLTAQHFSRISSRFPAGMRQSLNLIAEMLTEGTNPAISASSLTRPIKGTDARSLSCSSESTTLRSVYDIANAGPRNRFTVVSPEGHALLVHNCGYQGAVGAFAAMAQTYGVVIDPEDALRIVKQWRKANPQIVKFWYAMEAAAREAVLNPGQACSVGKIAFKRDGAWLKMRLPSQRVLCYPSPKIEDVKVVCNVCDGDGGDLVGEGEEQVFVECKRCKGSGTTWRSQVTYMGINQYSRRWERLKTYGGKLVENCVQATARDVIVGGMRAADDYGFELLLTVHDEVVAETNFNDAGLLCDCMTGKLGHLEWTAGLPLAAEGFEAERYRK